MQASDIPFYGLSSVLVSQRALHVLHSTTHSLSTNKSDEEGRRHRLRAEKEEMLCVYMRACLGLVFVLLFYFSGTTDYESIQTNKKQQKKPSPTKCILFRLMNFIINDNSMKQSIELNLQEKV